jgi:hypothetical protein
MTMPTDEFWEETDTEEQEQGISDDPAERYVALVKIVGSEVENISPAFTSCMTWGIPQSGANVPVQILPRRYKRHKARMQLQALMGATSVVFNSNYDALTLAVPQGFTSLAAGALPDWEGQQPLYAIAVGGTATVSIFDESYGEVA